MGFFCFWPSIRLRSALMPLAVFKEMLPWFMSVPPLRAGDGLNDRGKTGTNSRWNCTEKKRHDYVD